MDVSVIIVNYKTCPLVVDCINSIYEKTKGVTYEVIVVDNNSDDGSVETIIKIFPQVRIFPLKENIGFGKANNVGASNAKGEFLFFLNSDTILINNSIRILSDFLKTNEEVGLCGGNLYSKKMRINGNYDDNYPSLGDYLSYLFNKKTKSKERIIESRNSSIVKEVLLIAGADMMFRKNTFFEIGGFSPEFFMYFEEADISKKMQKNGCKSFFVPDSKIMHLYGGSSEYEDTAIKATQFFFLESSMLYAKKYFLIYYPLIWILFFLKAFMGKVYSAIKNDCTKKQYWRKYMQVILSINRS